ncbi:MAG: biotin/lipoyl-binding protein [Prevotellaceae bacterium]|jgi:biotin carboxyl carrier protein|nr:biotin/lipoyl-binding protein [Prevotellaceae bacterium]
MKKFSFDINGRKYEVNVKKVKGDIANLEVNGTPYEVKLHKEIATTKTPILVRQPVSNADSQEVATQKMTPVPSGARPSAKKIKSPLPGNVLKINVAVGDKIKDGDVLMVMESMKMENNILAEAGGTITNVNVPVGKAVLQDEVLFEYE